MWLLGYELWLLRCEVGLLELLLLELLLLELLRLELLLLLC